jgi:predicted GNAT superfamily acetyltransferase
MITIRPLASLSDFAQTEDIQRAVWIGAETQIVPGELMSVIAASGGAVIGAFDGDRLVGFVFSFLGTDGGAESQRPAMARLKHASHMLAVIDGYRGQDIGYRLKLAQRDLISRQGVRLVTWTFDPLESKNAYLNIARLGAICTVYKRNAYGDMRDALNTGLPSDRLIAEWWVTSPRVRQRLDGGRAALDLNAYLSAEAPILNPSVVAPDDGLPRPPGTFKLPEGLFALIEIPRDFQALKSYDKDLALEWRMHTRDVFEAVFTEGFMMTDFFVETLEGRPRSFYALSPREAPGAMDDRA